MKKEMSSFDVSSVVREMAILEDAHMDKIYQWGEGNVLFRINTKNDGKADLFFKDKKWLFLSPDRPETPETPTSFATFMRKYLTNARIGKASQIGFDRIVTLEVFKADADYQIIFEMFGGGNVLLVQDGKIVNCLTQRTFRDRATRPGEDYVMPKERFNPLAATEEEFSDEFRTSEGDTVRTLATVTNLGGQYAEEVCARSGVDKTLPAAEQGDGEIKSMYEALHAIVEDIKEHPQPTVFRYDGKIEDIAPVDMKVHDGCEKQPYDSISKAIGAFIAEAAMQQKVERTDPEIEKLKRRIEKQQETVDEYTVNAERLKTQADSLYTEYKKVSELLAVLGEQSKKLSWEKLTEGALKIPYVAYIDPSKNTVAVRIGLLEIELDYTKNIDANASDIYAKGKEQSEKAANAMKALNDSREELGKKEKGFEKVKAAELSKAAPTKRFWFEAFKWFITSEGRLALAGRDTHSNDSVVKKHMKEKDIYAHADIHGAPSVVLKEGLSATPDEFREACWFALAQSKAWTAGSPEGGAFWAYPDQVSKTPNAGEFVPRGAFIIRGKRNWEYHIPLEMGIGEIYYQNARKVMCAPTPVIEKMSERYFVIKPSKVKNGRMAGDIAKAFEVPEEEVSRILPPGSVEIVRKVWPKDDEEESESE
ncbi:putative RNA-binding protein, eukaryotic snRNP -like protein [Thermoplasmatales archaeon BRNA1]|nr:putative RNA-binding protein, eukaryotic snRNP -like protein [Thermoplasmatales archaeon BRNA1]